MPYLIRDRSNGLLRCLSVCRELYCGSLGDDRSRRGCIGDLSEIFLERGNEYLTSFVIAVMGCSDVCPSVGSSTVVPSVMTGAEEDASVI